jgi:glycosyltransferase involved in cell wall biosynthesis
MFSSDKIFKLGTPHLVCIPVCKNEESFLIHTLHSVISNTLEETDILVVFLGADWESLPAHIEEEISSGKRIQCIEAKITVPCLPYAALHYLPVQYGSYDVIVVLPGVEVPYGWDARLALAAMQDEGIASVSPLCDVSPLFALLSEEHSQSSNLVTIDRLAYALGERRNVEVPALLCSCVYLRRPALNTVWSELINNKNLEFGTFCWALGKAFSLAGLHNVCCDHVYVVDRNTVHLTEMEEIAGQEEVRLINQAHPLTGVRQAIKEALTRGISGSIESIFRQPLQLHIAHSWGGGQERWLRDYCESDTKRTNLILRSIGTWGAFGKAIALYRPCHMDTPLRYWNLSYPIRSTVITHLQYKVILQEIIDEFGVEIILVSSLIGHSLDVLNTDIKTVFITHDYYPFCPAINIFFNGICEECAEERLKRCFLENEHNRFFKNATVPEWMGIRKHFVELLANSNISLASPSESVARYLKILITELRYREFKIIHHGVNFVSSWVNNEVHLSGKLRIIVLGSLALHKGRRLLEEIYPELYAIADFYLVGCGEEGGIFEGKSGIYLIPQYEYNQLPEIVAKIDPHIGLLLSIVPETYSYTLSELWILRIPPVATNIGSFADRIIDGVNGFLCQPTKSSVIKKINWVTKNVVVLNQVRQRLIDWKHHTTKEMVEKYHALTPLPEFSARRYFLKHTDIIEVANEASPIPGINSQERFMVVAQNFEQYVLQKVSSTPRFGGWQKKLIFIAIKSSFRLLRTVTKMFPMR